MSRGCDEAMHGAHPVAFAHHPMKKRARRPKTGSKTIRKRRFPRESRLGGARANFVASTPPSRSCSPSRRDRRHRNPIDAMARRDLCIAIADDARACRAIRATVIVASASQCDDRAASRRCSLIDGARIVARRIFPGIAFRASIIRRMRRAERFA